MTPETTTALISASAAVVTAVVAMLLNHRGFTTLDNRITDTHRRIDDVIRRLDSMQTDFKDFFKTQAEHD